MRVIAPTLALLLVALAVMPGAAAPGATTGPLAFDFVSQDCQSTTLAPPGLSLVVLQQASGINFGTPVASSLVVLLLNPGGYALCQAQPGGGFVTSGDGSGTIVWA